MKRCASKKLIINRMISLHCTKLLSGIQKELEKMKQNLITLHLFRVLSPNIFWAKTLNRLSDTSRTETD